MTGGAPLAELLRLDDAGFRAAFAGTAVKRTGRNRFIRNVLIAAGNSGDGGLLPQVRTLMADDSPLVRAMAVWAASRLLDADGEFTQLRNAHLPRETDDAVRAEWLYEGEDT
jgi:epoxyqueuosine reductase